MCGINGVINIGKKVPVALIKVLSLMNDQVIHRGPDDEGFFTDENELYSVGMAMRRLSIIDLPSGHQPIISEDKKKVIVFNGEIYNYKILKQLLIDDGTVFKTNSDTEVILKLYEKKGVESFSDLDGMFAFSIYDKTLNKIFIARDFFGEKPLYYYKVDQSFYWASELKSILKNIEKPPISENGLSLFFQLTYIPAPFTIYKGINKLKANHFLEIDCNNLNVNEKKINPIKNSQNEKPVDFKEATKTIHDLVFNSVESRTVADVPLGTFLSGGVDSSIVSLCLAKLSGKQIDTFSIGFEKNSFDETEKARVVSSLIKSDYHEFILKENDLKEKINEILLNFDEPFADSSSLASFLVANKTRNYVKVALTGDGGDEMFGGYNKYYMGKLNSRYTKLIPEKLHNSFKRYLTPKLSLSNDHRGLKFKAGNFIKAIDYGDDFYYNIISLGFKKSEMNVLLKNHYDGEVLINYKNDADKTLSTLNQFKSIDKQISLEGDLLVKVDRTSMLNSLECRAPFLNKEIWEFTSHLPDQYLIKGWDKKFILKEAFKKYFPEKFLDMPKKGFGVPVGDWLRGSLKKELLSFANREFLIKQKIFHEDYVTALVAKHISGEIDNTFRLWTFYCFQKWYTNTYEKTN